MRSMHVKFSTTLTEREFGAIFKGRGDATQGLTGRMVKQGSAHQDRW